MSGIESGDRVQLAVTGKVWRLAEVRGIPVAFVRAGGNDYMIPFSELGRHDDGAWYATPRCTDPMFWPSLLLATPETGATS